MLFSNKQPNPLNITGDIHQINFSIDDFKRIREDDFLYIDKSKMIEDILKYDKGKVLLFTRPRRFGKSLNLSMLRYFFDMTEDSRNLFNDLYIEKSEIYQESLNQYPVLFLNFKDVTIRSEKSIEETLIFSIENELQKLYNKYQYEELKHISLITQDGSINIQAVKKITEVLCNKTGKKVIVLIDEYDSLLNQTYGTPYWIEAAGMIRKIFGTLLKSNEYLEMGILTGVSRIGRELGFSDMNNLSVYGMIKEFYYEYYGFTEAEVKELLNKNQIEMKQDFYKMYDGYHIDNSPCIFNTVSILKFLDDYYKTGHLHLSPYWINSSTNSILKDNIKKMDVMFRNKLLRLLEGSTIIEGIFENIDYDKLDTPSHMLSLLIDTGYLCPIKKMGGNLFEIKIPNEEVLYGYQDMINSITGTGSEILENLCGYLTEGNIESFEDKLNDILLQVSSFNDFSERENSYHCLLEGAFLYMLGRYKIRSNREGGLGRYDLSLIPSEYFKKMYKPIIIEIKAAKESYKKKECSEEELFELAEKALKQIEEMKYYEEYKDEYKKEQFLLIGIGAQGKRCRVVSNMPL